MLSLLSKAQPIMSYVHFVAQMSKRCEDLKWMVGKGENHWLCLVHAEVYWWVRATHSSASVKRLPCGETNVPNLMQSALHQASWFGKMQMGHVMPGGIFDSRYVYHRPVQISRGC